MQFTVNNNDNYLFITLEGDLLGDSNGMQLMDIANDAIAQGTLNCILDLAKIRYMNSSGIGVLVTLLSKYSKAEGKLIMLNPSEQIQKLLKITKLSDVFTIVDTKDEALEHIKG